MTLKEKLLAFSLAGMYPIVKPAYNYCVFILLVGKIKQHS